MPQAKKRPWSVRSLLIGFGLAVAAPLVLLLGALLIRGAALERTQLEHRMLQLVSNLADNIDRDLDRRITTLKTLATSPTLARGDLARFHAQATAALQDSGAGIFLLDPKSLQQLVNTYAPFGSELPTYGSPETARRVIETKQPQVSDFFIGRISQRPAFDVVVPIVNNGQIRYLLSLGLTPEDLRPILTEQKLDPGWVSTVWDRNNVLLARSRDHELFAGRSIERALSSAVLRDTNAVFRTMNLDQEEVLLAVATSRLAGWHVSVNVPLSIVEIPLKYSLSLWGVASAFVLMVAALLAFAFGNLLERPLSAAADAARAFGEGRTIDVPSGRIREVNDLNNALLGAVDKQRLLMGELSHRVKNILAVVQALVMRSVSDTDTREVISRRLQALSRAHDMLIGSDWRGTSLVNIVTTEVSSFSDRVEIEGPEIILQPNVVQSFALTLHELATNATKYGALSNEIGSVHVAWHLTGSGENARFHFAWRERGGPPVASPTRKGFGTMLLETSLPGRTDAQPRLTYSPEGFVYEFEIPLAAITDTGAHAQS